MTSQPLAIIGIMFTILFLASAQPSFSDHEDINVNIPAGSSNPGCETSNTCFIPSQVIIDVGGTVTWINDDTAAHTVTSGVAGQEPDGKFDSSLFMAGQTFSHTFNAAGNYPYYCVVHPWMTGIVEVSSTTSEIIFSNLRLTDIAGNIISQIQAGQQAIITADVTNNKNSQQSFVFSVEIRDADGITVYNSWVSGSLNPRSSGSPGVSNTFTSAGTYQIYARLFDNVQNPTVLAPQLTKTVSISDGSSQIVTVDTDESQYKNGDTMTIFGNVSPVNTSTPVLIQIFSATDALIRVEQVPVSPSGQYAIELVAGGVLWGNNPTMITIKATYNQATDETEIEYSGAAQPKDELKLSLSIEDTEACDEEGRIFDLMVTSDPPVKRTLYVLGRGSMENWKEWGSFNTDSNGKGTFQTHPIYMKNEHGLPVYLRVYFNGDNQFEYSYSNSVSINAIPECEDILPTVGEGELDPDNDEILNKNDQCALDAEDFDGYQDTDGCPEENPPPIGPEIYAIIIIVVAIGIGIGIFAMKKRKSSDSEEPSLISRPSSPPSQPPEKEPDYALDDSKLK